MSALVPIITLLVVLALGFVVVRVGMVALIFTGLSKDLAWFQAHSAFMGVGFTTRESEQITEHPVRRRIAWWLMLLGNAGLIAAISALIPVFITSGEGMMGFWARLLWLISGLVLLWTLASSRFVDSVIYRATNWALRRWTTLELSDFPALLQFSAGYSVTEIAVEPAHWLVGKTLMDLRLPDEGVQMLGIRRADGEYVGTPVASTYIRRGDTLLVYGRSEQIAEIGGRSAGAEGDIAHARRVQECRRLIEQTELTQRMEARDAHASPDAVESNTD